MKAKIAFLLLVGLLSPSTWALTGAKSPEATMYLKVLYPKLDVSPQSKGMRIDPKIVPDVNELNKNCNQPTERVASFQAKDLPFDPGKVAVLVETQLSCGELELDGEYYQAEFAVFSKGKNPGEAPTLLGRFPIEDEDSNIEPWLVKSDDVGASYSFEAKFDFAPYLIRKGLRAFGYRLNTQGHHANAENDREQLKLFALNKNGRVDPVFDYPMRIRSAWDDVLDTDKPEKPKAIDRTIQISKDVKNGASIWKVTSKLRLYENYQKFEVNEVESKKTSSQTFVWDGTSYKAEAAGK